MSEQQVFQLRQQIMAYKYLIRNIPIPQELEKNLSDNLSTEQWEIEKEKIFNRSLKFFQDKVEKNEDIKKLINDNLNKQKSLKDQ